MPTQSTPSLKSIFRAFLLLLPILCLIALRQFLGGTTTFSSSLFIVAFSIVVYFFVSLLKLELNSGNKLKFNLFSILLVGISLLGGISSVVWNSVFGAWAGLAALFALSLEIHRAISGKYLSIRWWLTAFMAGGLLSLIVVVFNQILVRFSDEEFFAAVQTILFFVGWLAFAIASTFLPRFRRLPAGRLFERKLGYAIAISALLLGIWGLVAFRSYQSSFYGLDPDPYPAITAENPFLCGTAKADTSTVEGSQILQDYIQKISANPKADPSLLAFLFLNSGDLKWATAFHDSLLKEASLNLYTAPANSVKFDQYLAALRVYAYSQVRSRKPDLFSKEDQAQIENWFHAINRRAMTVEWVDWMYSLAFSMSPTGPYENQENGAGLIALLEAEKLGDPALSQKNLDYLAHNPRGWAARFRNTDDSLPYQAEWITNAYFQKIFTGIAPSQNVENSFEWILLQMLPDGRSPQYNLPDKYNLGNTLLFGASLLTDNRLLWVAGKALQTQNPPTAPPYPQTGLAGVSTLNGQAPTQGSCLIYGDSGLPTQKGPLAPDKIVFRDGWSNNDAYLLENLRFTGWHRYKGTNTITLIDRSGPLVNEQIEGEAFPWLPKGRSLFRDKRIPRENLNGFQISRQGLDAVLYQLLGYGGPWAQNPPYFARVDEFSIDTEMDVSQSTLVNWLGWNQSRRIFFRHDGIIAILDEAQGPAFQSGAVTWNISGKQQISNGRFLLDNQNQKGEMLLLSREQGTIQVLPISAAGEQNFSQILYTGPQNGHLKLVTVFLTGEWLGAQANLSETLGQEYLTIQRSGKTVQIEMNLFKQQ